MSRRIERAAILGAILLFCFGVGRSAQFKYREKIDAIVKANAEERKKLGIPEAEVKKKFPSPEIAMVTMGCLLPGGTAEVVAKGKFAPGTKFVIESDDIEVVKESVTATEYRATVRAASLMGPASAALRAITPVSSAQVASSDRIEVGGRYQINLDGKNGWKIVATNPDTVCGKTKLSDAKYKLDFFKAGQAQPFESARASLSHNPWSAMNYGLSIEAPPEIGGNEQARIEAIVKKFSDPNLTPAQQEKLMQEMQQINARLQAEAKKFTDPVERQKIQAAQEKRKREFGCTYIELSVKGGNANGKMSCGAGVGDVVVSGTLKLLGQ